MKKSVLLQITFKLLDYHVQTKKHFCPVKRIALTYKPITDRVKIISVTGYMSVTVIARGGHGMLNTNRA